MNVIWDELIKKNLLVGSESKQKFLHLNNSETYKKMIETVMETEVKPYKKKLH